MARPFDNLPPTLIRQGPPPGQARRELLLLHDAWLGPASWTGLAEPLAAAGYGLNLLELPGHGESAWEPPALTSLTDYAGLARRAVAGLERPVLAGHGLGGWLVQKIWEVADLPGILINPLPPSGLPWLGLARLLSACPTAAARCLAGRPLALPSPAAARLLGAAQADLVAWLRPEPARAALEMLAGWPRCRPSPGRAERLVLIGGADRLVPAARQVELARALGARAAILPKTAHWAWRRPESLGQILELALGFLGAC